LPKLDSFGLISVS